MNKEFLFIDGSVHAQSKVGFGAYLCISNKNQPLEELKGFVKTKRFENTSSTKLELQTLLWALGEIDKMNRKIIIFTDSQNIIGLPQRRERFEKNEYQSKNKKLLTNHELYKEFFKLTEVIEYELIKVRGHKPTMQKTNIEKRFSIVDKASRNALRNINI